MAFLSCPKCPTTLRIPDGASGNVKCPKCEALSFRSGRHLVRPRPLQPPDSGTVRRNQGRTCTECFPRAGPAAIWCGQGRTCALPPPKPTPTPPPPLLRLPRKLLWNQTSRVIEGEPRPRERLWLWTG